MKTKEKSTKKQLKKSHNEESFEEFMTRCKRVLDSSDEILAKAKIILYEDERRSDSD
jgi:hypothetical protein